MHRELAAVAVLSILACASCAAPAGPRTEGRGQGAEGSWSVRADYTDVCCCSPPCPCLFGSPSSKGHCHGVTLVEFTRAHLGDVRLDGVKVLAVYGGGKWMKFYVTDRADSRQTKAAVKLLPTFEKFFAVKNVLEVKNAPIRVERSEGRVRISTENTVAEIVVMKGRNGRPIKSENLPVPEFPAPPYEDHTQYRSVILRNTSPNGSFEYSGTNGYTARLDTSSEAGNE